MDNIETTLNEIKDLLAKLIGTSDLPKGKQFSVSAIEKAAKEFKKLRRENNAWIKTHEIRDYIKDAPYEAGKFIRDEFEFKNFYTKGPACYYLKGDIVLLAEELKKRKIDLRAYMQMKEKEKKDDDFNIVQKKNPQGSFKVPDNISNIQPRSKKPKSLEKLTAKLNQLNKQYNELQLSQYIDIVDDIHAFPKLSLRIGDVPREMEILIHRWCRKFSSVNEDIISIENKSS